MAEQLPPLGTISAQLVCLKRSLSELQSRSSDSEEQATSDEKCALCSSLQLHTDTLLHCTHAAMSHCRSPPRASLLCAAHYTGIHTMFQVWYALFPPAVCLLVPIMWQSLTPPLELRLASLNSSCHHDNLCADEFTSGLACPLFYNC